MNSAKLVQGQTAAMGHTYQNLTGGITWFYMTHDFGAEANQPSLVRVMIGSSAGA